tara:strand:+ start:2443 stop:3726 length:1284 start_codon:yes stop_codon:yes gene_type:complete
MNIIQLQDDLKGLPDNTLIGYVQNPTGAVPTYLALGELERRTKMRERFQQEVPTETVSEQIIAEAVPQGIGSILPTDATPTMPPLEEVMSETITDTGIATLPAENIGTTFEAGGIVGYAGEEGSLVELSDEDMEDVIIDPMTGLPTLVNENIAEETITPYNAAFTPKYGTAAVEGPLKMPAQLTQKTAALEQERSQEEFGIDRTIEKDYRSSKEAELKALKNRKQTNINMAMIKAGAKGLQSTNRTALGVLGEVIEEGANSYEKSDKDLKDETRLLKDTITSSRRLEDAQKRGDLKAVKASVVARNANILAVAKINLEYDSDIKKALATAGAAGKNIYNTAWDNVMKELEIKFPGDLYNSAFLRDPKLMTQTINKMVKDNVKFLTTGELPIPTDKALDSLTRVTKTLTGKPLTKEIKDAKPSDSFWG